MAHEHVLVVDDEQDIRELLEFALKRQGYRVTTADNGATALESAARDPADVVLLDMRMPVMDGWAFAEAYRQRPARAPIIVITAAENAAARAAQIQADDYIAKPFDLDDLLSVVARHAHRA